MEAKMERERSPSLQQSSLHPASSPHFAQENTSGLNSAMTFNANAYNSPPSPADQYHYNAAFMNAPAQPAPYQAGMAANDFPSQDMDAAFKRSLSNGPQRPQHLTLQNSNHQFPSDYHQDPSPGFVDQFAGQDLGVKQESAYGNLFMVDPTLQSSSAPPPNQSINPQDVMASMSPQPNHLPTPTNLIGVDARLSPKQSPSSRPPPYHSPNHSRNASGSLAPSSAGYAQVHPSADWSNMIPAEPFQQHRRAPSEHSDFSSVGPSPFLAQQESFDAFDQSHSPLLTAQGENALYQESMGIEKFSISDQQQQQQQQQRQGLSPRHSPYPSPRMSPHGSFNLPPESSFVLPSNDLARPNGPGAGMFEPHDQAFADFRTPDPHDMGQAAQMAPPEINVELAPPSRPAVESSLSNHDALSPPEGRRGRMRAKSDPSFPHISRPLTPTDASPALAALDHRHRSLSPFEVSSLTPHYGRESSPVGPGTGKTTSRRSSTSSIPNRDYILELADPTRPSASGDNRQRVQKHPATFQCTLCPKRFTRAYNLRSHLRTHTDERPFVCTVCGKAFARQHDRKRHEGLHSGEKKFVCRGELASGGSWGCGRRFARADALGRHFRSEAGRVCIKPLLDEEALERQRQFEEQMLVAQRSGSSISGGPSSAPGMMAGAGMVPPQPMDVGGAGFALPAALLAQYPALQGLQWDQLGSASGQEGDESGEGVEGKFDGSGGGAGEDWMEEQDEGTADGYVSGQGMGYGAVYGQGEWASDYEGGR